MRLRVKLTLLLNRTKHPFKNSENSGESGPSKGAMEQVQQRARRHIDGHLAEVLKNADSDLL